MRIPSPVPPVPISGIASDSQARRRAGAVALGIAAATLCLAVGTGWIDALRAWKILSAGPQVHDALPLRQLAGHGSQPLLRVAVAWLLTGAMGAYLLRSHRTGARAALLGVPFFVLYVQASNAEYALAHNLRAWQVIQSRGPTVAAFVAAACLVVGASLIPIRRR